MVRHFHVSHFQRPQFNNKNVQCTAVTNNGGMKWVSDIAKASWRDCVHVVCPKQFH